MHLFVAIVALVTGSMFQVAVSISAATPDANTLNYFAIFVVACIIATKNMRHPYKLITKRSWTKNFDAYIASTALIGLIVDSVLSDVTRIANPVPIITIGFMYVGIRHLLKGLYPVLYEPS